MTQLYCLEKLEKEVEKINGVDSVTAAKARRMSIDHIGCFIQFARQNDERFDKLYEYLKKLDERSKARSSPRWWFVDKVLPNIITWAIIGAITWIWVVTNRIQVISGG